MNRSLVMLARVVVGALGGLLILGCTPSAPQPVARRTPSPTPVAPLIVGAILNVSRDAGPNGTQRYEAATLAVELVNRRGGLTLSNGERRPLLLDVYDDAGELARTAPALRRLVEDGALAVVGPSSPDSAYVARPAAEAAAIPTIVLDDSADGEYARWRWTFGLAIPPEEALAATIDFFAASSVDRFAWLAPRTMHASSLRRSLSRLATLGGMRVVSEEAYAPGDDAFAQRLARLQAGDPRVILAWPRNAEEAAAITRESTKVRELVPVFLGPAAANPATLMLAGDAGATVRTLTLRLPVADDLWDHDALTPVIRDFRRELQARTGRPPTLEAAAAWDAVRLLVATIERGPMNDARNGSPNGVPPSRATIRERLEATTDYLGASGTIAFGPGRHDGLDRRALIVARSEGRRWRLPP